MEGAAPYAVCRVLMRAHSCGLKCLYRVLFASGSEEEPQPEEVGIAPWGIAPSGIAPWSSRRSPTKALSHETYRGFTTQVVLGVCRCANPLRQAHRSVDKSRWDHTNRQQAVQVPRANSPARDRCQVAMFPTTVLGTVRGGARAVSAPMRPYSILHHRYCKLPAACGQSHCRGMIQ
jgi:hypothetical protein